jgi:hypothetical protein
VVIITSSAFTKCELHFHWRDGISPEIKTRNFIMSSGPVLKLTCPCALLSLGFLVMTPKPNLPNAK